MFLQGAPERPRPPPAHLLRGRALPLLLGLRLSFEAGQVRGACTRSGRRGRGGRGRRSATGFGRRSRYDVLAVDIEREGFAAADDDGRDEVEVEIAEVVECLDEQDLVVSLQRERAGVALRVAEHD